MKRILIVFGTRPEAIKMAPLVIALKKYPEEIALFTCVTAQHRQMLDQVLNVFDITPEYDLDIMRAGQDLSDVTVGVINGLRAVFAAVKPDICLVHGDTTTSMAAGLAAFYHQVAVGHVEAGLRTYQRYSPFPEEMNRQLTSRLSTYHFAPTATSEENLLREGVASANILVTGNTVIDALLTVVQRIDADADFSSSLVAGIASLGYTLGKRPFILVTGHRRENFGEGFENICRALRGIAEQRPDYDIVYPVHLNPNVRRPVQEILVGIDNVHLLEPLAYAEFVLLMKHAYLILTDSGGIQEEGPSLCKPVLVMRDTTERPEAISAGTARLVGTNTKTIVEAVVTLIDDPLCYAEMSNAANPYGTGDASEKIVQFLRAIL